MTNSAAKVVSVKSDLRATALAASAAFREDRTQQGTLVVRLISSPGSGKTSLLAATAQQLAQEARIAVLVGDIETDRDAQRLKPFAPTAQITTGGACHLELALVERALPQVSQVPMDYLFIEDVGNLICPASHDLGEHLRVLLLSVTEGDDKPAKYPKAFRTSDVVVFTKTDLLPHVPFSVARAQEDAQRIRDDLVFFEVSTLHAAGMGAWLDFLRAARERILRQPKAV